MTRIRTDNVAGTTTDNPLTAAATTMNSAGLANLAVVSSAEAIIILDPNRINGAPEHVVVTAHTGSATSATIVRGQFGTTARSHPLGTEWVHGPIASNATSFVTAADDQGDFVPMNAWEAYTPTDSNITVGNGTRAARFRRNGRNIDFVWSLTFGSTTAFTGSVGVGLPVAAAAGTRQTNGGAYLLDSGTQDYGWAIMIGASGTTAGVRNAAGGGADATTPFTWTTNDVLVVSGTYEAAS